MKTYFIRVLSNNAMVNAFEGADGKKRADELMEINNKFNPTNKWFVSEETI